MNAENVTESKNAVSDYAADALLEPAKAYREQYAKQFHRNADELFDQLVIESGIDPDANRKKAEAYRKKDAEAKAVDKKCSSLKGWRIFLIVLLIGGIIAGFVGLGSEMALLGAVGFPLSIFSLLIILVVLNPKIKALKSEAAKLFAAANTLLSEAEKMLFPLFNLFDTEMTPELIEKTVPTLVVDKNFSMRRYDYMHGKYGLPEQEDGNTSTLGIASGEIIGNPFLFERILRHRMGMQTYTGTLIIHWTTTSRNSEGKIVTHHHTQTLMASVRKPKPFYHISSRLIYGNEAAESLSFSHQRSHAEKLSERELESTVKSGVKKLRKQAKKQAGFTEMGNEEFDVLFGALDRDNEVQFRLLFTSLAQKNMLALMKGDSPYGDDFNFYKNKCLNTVISEHGQTFDPDINTAKYHSYDIDYCRNNFLNYNDNYFKNLFFDLAPLLSIPLYQQHKPHEYIYQTSYPRHFPTREAEVMANRMGSSAFAPTGNRTQLILKTRLAAKTEKSDKLIVSASGYRTVRRLEVVPTMGGDGRIHAVPVHWIEYIPVYKESTMELSALDISEPEYNEGENFAEQLPHAFHHRILSVLGVPLTAEAAEATEEEEESEGEVVEGEAENNMEDAAALPEDFSDPKN